jgi:hypothetical protein
MKTLLLASAVAALVAVMNLSAASAAGEPQNGSPTATGTSHYEWQYHYVGHHPRYEGHWVWVK